METRRRSLLLPSANADVSSPKSVNYGIFIPQQASKMTRNSSITFGRADSSMRKVLGAFGTIPTQETWLKSGIVERQTVSTDMLWLPRLMILTSDAIVFAKEGSEVVLDRFPLKNVTFVGKVMQHCDIIRGIVLTLCPSSGGSSSGCC